MLKADFMKAYDCVKYVFIWDVMKAMGFATHITTLAQGLVELAKSKVHVNGRFTWPIKLERGVRQGCPLPALLYIISTQPFMAMLREKVALGELDGIQIGENHQLTHELFADDIDIFFKATERNFQYVRDIIMRYESVSRAHLNLSKAIVIPLYLRGPIPNWMIN